MLKYIKKKLCLWRREERQMQQQRIPLLLSPEQEEKLKNEEIKKTQIPTATIKPATPEERKFLIEMFLLSDYAQMQAALFPNKYKNSRDYMEKEVFAYNGNHDFTLTTLDD